MIVNTNGTLKLNKRERDRLTQAMEIVCGLVKHADGDLQEAAVQVETAMVRLEEVLSPEPALVPPY